MVYTVTNYEIISFINPLNDSSADKDSKSWVSRNFGHHMICPDRNGGFAYARVCTNGILLADIVQLLRCFLALHPGELGECWWEEWDSKTGNLHQPNCSFKRSARPWVVKAQYYQIPTEFQLDFNQFCY